MAAGGAGSAACSAPPRTVRTEFWQEAPADPVIELDRPELLAADATEITLEIRGVVIAHRPQTAGVGEWVLDLLVVDGDDGKAVSLSYTLAGGRRIPVEKTWLIRAVLQQFRDPPARPVRALYMEALVAPNSLRRNFPVAVVQANGLLAANLVPRALQAIAPADEVVYQSTVRLEGQCVRSAAHRSFRVQADAARDQPTQPGSRLRLGSGADVFDVQLGDNRQVLSSDCSDLANDYWVFSATRTSNPLGTRGELGAIGIFAAPGAPANLLPAPPTPTGR